MTSSIVDDAGTAMSSASRSRPNANNKDFQNNARSHPEGAARSTMTALDNRRRWLAFTVLCLASLMIVLDATVVNVALPSIRSSLSFSQTHLAWVVNAYLLTFGGLLLLGGRLGDLFGARRLFLCGVTLFTVASTTCGLANSQAMLVAARAVQGAGGAIASAVSLALMMHLFTDPVERAKAMGIFGFVVAGGGSIGVLLGGVITGMLSWHWIFLVNVPVGIAVCLLSLGYVPAAPGIEKGRIDIAGAVTVTSALMAAVYAIVNGNQTGWTSTQTLALLATAAGLLTLFLAIEVRVPTPLVPLALLRLRNLATANALGMLWAAAMFAWFFIAALYLQLVLGYSPLRVGLAFLPANLIMAAFSIGLSAKLVIRLGIKVPIATGLLLVAAGLALFARAPIDGHFLTNILPSMLLLGVGAGMALNPVMLAATSDVAPEHAGVASGLLNTAIQMGGALGLAILASIAASTTTNQTTAGHSHLTALTGGYHAAFLAGAVFAALAAALATTLVGQGDVEDSEYLGDPAHVDARLSMPSIDPDRVLLERRGNRHVHRAKRAEAARAAPNPAAALTIDTEAHPPKVLLIRGQAELDAVDGIPHEYLQWNGAYQMTPEQRAEWEAGVRSLYDGMVRIVLTPTWAKLIDFETTLPTALEELM